MRGGAGQQGGGGTSSASLNFFWYTLTVVIAMMLLWYFFQPYLVTFILWLRRQEIILLKSFAALWNPMMSFLNLSFLKINTTILTLWEKFTVNAKVKEVNFREIKAISYGIGTYLRYLVSPCLVGLAIHLFNFHKSSRYRKTYNMKDLRGTVHKNWPEITPVMHLDLIKQPLMKGPWAMSQTPLEFCKEHHLLTTKVDKDGKTVWHLLRAPAHRVLVLQLGPLWNHNALKQPIHVQALIVIFIACAQKNRKLAKHFLKQIALSSRNTKNLDFSGVREALAKYSQSKSLTWVSKRHAYLGTMLASLLEIARTDGVLATSEFLWLKPVDRRLWYMLNSVGRQTAFIEVAGLFAHWLAEKTFKCPLKTPMIKEAVIGLQAAIKDTLYKHENEKSWHYDVTAEG